MDAHNALQQMLRSPHLIPDPGDAKRIEIDRDRMYCSLNPAGTETRTLAAPPTPGLRAHLGCLAAQTVTVTVQEINTTTNALSTTGTITFTAAGQWIGMESYELSAGVYAWQATDVYGCTTTVQTAGNWSAAVAAGSITELVGGTASIASILATNISIGTGLTAPNIVASSAMSVNSILGTNISCASMSVSSNFRAASILATNLSVATQATIPNILCSSNLSVASVLATNISVATAATIPNVKIASAMTMGGTVIVSGGSTAGAAAASDCVGLSAALNVISVGTSTRNYFKLPTAAQGLIANVINLGSTVAILGHTAGVSIASQTSTALATANATGSALDLFCDGTNWWHNAV